MNREVHKTLLEDDRFIMLLEDLRKSRPNIAKYDIKAHNGEQVLADHLFQQGYDLAMAIVNPFKKEN